MQSQPSVNDTIESDDMLNELTELQGITYLQDAHDYRSIDHRIDIIGIRVHRMIFSRVWLWIMKITLIFLLFMAFFESPSSTSASSLITNNTKTFDYSTPGPIPNSALYSIELILLTIILIDCLLQSFIFGFKRTLRSPWLILVFALVLISYIDLAVSVGVGMNYTVRIRRFFRPFFLIQRSQLMKKVLKSLSKTMGDIFSAFFLLFIWIMAFTIIALSTFNGDEALDSQYITFYKSFFTLLVLTTTANNPDAMVNVYNKNRLGFLFFLVFMVVGIFVFMNVLIAIIFNEFRSHILDSMQASRFRRRIASRAMFEVLCKAPSRTTNVSLHSDTSDAALLRKVVNRSSISKWCKQAMIENLDSLGIEVVNWENLLYVLTPLDEHKESHKIYKLPKYSHPTLARVQHFILSKSFEIIGLMVCLCNIIVIAIDVSHNVKVSENDNKSKNLLKTLVVLNWIFVAFYINEQIAKIWAMGPKSYFTKRICIYDFVITIIILCMKIIVEIAIGISGNKRVNGIFLWTDLSRVTNLIILLRAARITKLFPSLSPIISTLFDVPWRMTAIFGVLLVLFYEYALFGMILFSGKINWEFYQNETEPGEYKQLNYGALNFDDFYSSISVLWCLLIVNNWQVFVQTFSKAMGEYKKWVVHVYMISWWIFVVVIVMNCVTAFVIEAYTQQKAFYDEERVRRNRPHSLGDMIDESVQYLQQSVVVNESFTFQMLFKNDLIEPNEEQLVAKLKKCRFLCDLYPHIKY